MRLSGTLRFSRRNRPAQQPAPCCLPGSPFMRRLAAEEAGAWNGLGGAGNGTPAHAPGRHGRPWLAAVPTGNMSTAAKEMGHRCTSRGGKGALDSGKVADEVPCIKTLAARAGGGLSLGLSAVPKIALAYLPALPLHHRTHSFDVLSHRQVSPIRQAPGPVWTDRHVDCDESCPETLHFPLS